MAVGLREVVAGQEAMCVALRCSPWAHNAGRIVLGEAGGAIFTVDGDELPLEQKSTVVGLNSYSIKSCVFSG